ncbi:MAG: ATP-binding protein [Gaiellaceae bacterium]
MAYIVRRHVHDVLLRALEDTRVVVLLGARQTGKSTLTREIAASDHPADAVSLDDPALRDAAAADPAGFLAGFPRRVLIDEVQRAPDLLLAIKDAVDRDPTPGRFLLTGSANILTAPRIQEALTGRAEYVNLWPFSQAEINGSDGGFIDHLFGGSPPWVKNAPVGRGAFAEFVARGGYPEALARDDARRRRWYASYIRSLVERDLREIADAHKLEHVPRLLTVIASQAADLFAPTTMSNKLQLDNGTVQSYTLLLETLFIVKRIQAWTPNLGNREVHKPKIYLADSGLLAYLLGADEHRIATDPQVTGRILETFVAMEIARLREHARTETRQYHYRRDRDEIDIVLESMSGDIVAVEVKAAATIHPTDYRALVKLRDARADRFVAGAVVYTGASTIPLADRIWGIPISGLW